MELKGGGGSPSIKQKGRFFFNCVLKDEIVDSAVGLETIMEFVDAVHGQIHDRSCMGSDEELKVVWFGSRCSAVI